MTILKLNDIEKLYSEKVAEYIMKGYSINVEHSKGSQTNEVATICLSNDNGKTVLRVGLIRACKDWRKEELKLVVLKHENVNRCVLWISEGEVLEERTFYEVEDRKVYCESEEDINKILEIRKTRSKRGYGEENEKLITSEKIIKSLLKLVKREKGYKTVTKKCIKKVVRDTYGFDIFFENKYPLRIKL